MAKNNNMERSPGLTKTPAPVKPQHKTFDKTWVERRTGHEKGGGGSVASLYMYARAVYCVKTNVANNSLLMPDVRIQHFARKQQMGFERNHAK